MIDYFNLGQAFIKNFQTTEGTILLGEKGIKSFAKKNPELGKGLSELTEGITNPAIEILQKAQGNYSIACFKLKSGENLLEKGVYSTSKGTNGVVEKVHVESDGLITTMSKENGKTSTRIVEQPDSQDVKKFVEPQKHELSHEEKVGSFFKLQSDVIKGLDKNNHWIQRDISNLSSKELEELENLMNDAAKKGMKFPYDKDSEYIEMLLPMTDGRKHQVKIFPGFYEHNLNMRIFMDKDIPADKFKTYHDVSLSDNPPGAVHSFKIMLIDDLKKDLKSDNVLERLKGRKKLADKIKYMWQESDAKSFEDSYARETHYYLWQKGIHQSPLKPKD